MTRHSRNIVVTEAFTYKKKIPSDYTQKRVAENRPSFLETSIIRFDHNL